jgi:hypothetical protein
MSWREIARILRAELLHPCWAFAQYSATCRLPADWASGMRSLLIALISCTNSPRARLGTVLEN